MLTHGCYKDRCHHVVGFLPFIVIKVKHTCRRRVWTSKEKESLINLVWILVLLRERNIYKKIEQSLKQIRVSVFVFVFVCLCLSGGRLRHTDRHAKER